MQIGQKINEFDNSTGTVEEFNRIFPQTPLLNHKGRELALGDVEIGSIVGIGQETKRIVRLNISGVGKVFEHDFYPKQGDDGVKKSRHSEDSKKLMSEIAKNRIRKPRFIYIISDKRGMELARFFDRKKAGNFINVCGPSITNYLLGKSEHSEYNITRIKNK